MAPVWSKLRGVNEHISLQKVVIVSSLAVTFFATFRAITWDNSKRKKRPMEDLHLHLKEAKKDTAAVDSKFFRRLSRIIKILIPRLDCPETGFMILIAVSLALRTLCDVWMISKTTCLESDIVSRDRKAFFRDMLKFLTGLPVVSIVNQLLKYGLSELKLRFRTRLSLNLNDSYLSGFTYYKMSNLDNRITNPDQLLTEDIDKFCGSIVDLYSNVSKPILDIMIYVRRLTGAIGASGPAAMISYLAAAGLILTRLRKPIGKMTVQEQKLEGEFRHVNSRIITNSEEIAFYQGNKREQQTVKKSFWRLIDHLRDLLNFRCSVGIIDNIIAKYLATVVGLLVVGASFVNPDNERLNGLPHSQVMEHYYETGRMMIRLAEAIGRLVLAGRDMSRLSGFTARVTNLMDVLEDVKEGKYVRTMINQKSTDPALDDVKREKMDITRRNGTIIEQDYVIRFEDVPLVTPNGDVLVETMTFEVHSGKNVLVCGPNGCGKSSLFRVLGELWPLYGGVLTKPHRSQLFYVPQKPYMTVGTFRDQIIYPDSVGDMRVKGYTDQNIEEFVRQVHLEYILEREGWDTIQDWIDVLSGGEKQRVAMARMFYHQPQFAILDECTSAVSVDVEGFMYTRCREAGITLFTVSHRKSLWKYHEYVLYMDGRGSYAFTRREDATTDFGS